jgi:nucleotidyltransferase substrate binding protein (TIGR01987 family)
MKKNEIQNFSKTIHQLELFLGLPIQNDRDRAGIIQAFEFTFEQSWKSVQKIAGHQGVNVASPKQAFSFALSAGWIVSENEKKWLKMIEDRNLTSHTYKEELAKEILSRIQSDYIFMFKDLISKLIESGKML